MYMETFSERKYIKLCTGRRFQRENTAVYMHGDVFREKLQLCTWRGTKAVYMETFSERNYSFVHGEELKLCTWREKIYKAVYRETFSERKYSCVHGDVFREKLQLCTWRHYQRGTKLFTYANVYMCYPCFLLHTELILGLFIRCTII